MSKTCFSRSQEDLKETYKFLAGSYVTPSNTYFEEANLQLRGHSKKLQKHYSRTLVRKKFFANRIVDDWNALPEKTVAAPSV